MADGTGPASSFCSSSSSRRFLSLPIASGISPEKRLDWRLNVCSPTRLSISGGITPDMRLPARFSTSSCGERRTTERGITPANLLPSRSISAKALQLVRLSTNSQPPPASSVAVSWLFDSSSDSGQSVPISPGTCPAKLLFARLRATSAVAFDSDAGIGPARRLPPRKRYWRFGVRAPASPGSSPRNAFSASARPRSDVMLKNPTGISPARLFCDKANMPSAGRRDKPSGMEPSRRFWSSSSRKIFVRFASDGGMRPESELWLSRSTARLGSAPSHRGTPPTRLLLLRYATARAVQLRSASGISPANALSQRLRYRIRRSRPRPPGMLPEKALEVRLSTTSRVRLATAGESSPARRPMDTSSDVTRPAVQFTPGHRQKCTVSFHDRSTPVGSDVTPALNAISASLSSLSAAAVAAANGKSNSNNTGATPTGIAMLAICKFVV
uniref:Uncharacterized protein n=1 Tax=Oryza nivara TaxID=4536 RepID=A0A0E0GWS3_ORYNI